MAAMFFLFVGLRVTRKRMSNRCYHRRRPNMCYIYTASVNSVLSVKLLARYY